MYVVVELMQIPKKDIIIVEKKGISKHPNVTKSRGDPKKGDSKLDRT